MQVYTLNERSITTKTEENSCWTRLCAMKALTPLLRKVLRSEQPREDIKRECKNPNFIRTTDSPGFNHRFLARWLHSPALKVKNEKREKGAIWDRGKKRGDFTRVLEGRDGIVLSRPPGKRKPFLYGLSFLSAGNFSPFSSPAWLWHLLLARCNGFGVPSFSQCRKRQFIN